MELDCPDAATAPSGPLAGVIVTAVLAPSLAPASFRGVVDPASTEQARASVA